MKHFASTRFWRCFDALPVQVQELAQRNHSLLKQNPAHPSLQLKTVSAGRFRSVRVGLSYRALDVPVVDGVMCYWVGTHAEYDKLIS